MKFSNLLFYIILYEKYVINVICSISRIVKFIKYLGGDFKRGGI